MEGLKWVFCLGLMTGGLFKLFQWEWGNEILVITWLVGSVYCIYKMIKG